MPPHPGPLPLIQTPALPADPARHAGASEVTFDRLFDRYARYVATIAFRLLGGDAEVDDVVQDVFCAAAQQLHKLSDMERAKGWLSTVTVRVARRKLRRRRLRAFLHLDAARGEELVLPGLGPDDRALAARVYERLGHLNQNHRIAWSLRHLEGQSLEEVASACECSLATAKRWIFAAQQALEESFRDG